MKAYTVTLKKAIFIILLLSGIFLLTGYVSFSISRKQANLVAERYRDIISPLKGELVLFIDGDFRPCWVFRGEPKELLSGSTYDVYVSLTGKIIQE